MESLTGDWVIQKGKCFLCALWKTAVYDFKEITVTGNKEDSTNADKTRGW